eukprot:366258-Chlamydomonas_euryale.AAC.18
MGLGPLGVHMLHFCARLLRDGRSVGLQYSLMGFSSADNACKVLIRRLFLQTHGAATAHLQLQKLECRCSRTPRLGLAPALQGGASNRTPAWGLVIQPGPIQAEGHGYASAGCSRAAT